MKALAIAGVNAKRLVRDRIGLFFLFVFPVVLILLLGVAFGGDFSPRLGVVSSSGGPLGEELVDGLSEDSVIEVERYADVDALVDAVEKGDARAGMIVPEGYDADLRAGRYTEIGYLAPSGETSTTLRTAVDAAVADQGAQVRATLFATELGVGDFDQVAEIAETAADDIPTIAVNVENRGGDGSEDVGRFDLGASSQLVLFMFVNSLAGTVALIQSRRLGVSRRMLSTPMTAKTILLGEALGRFAVAMIQGVFIVVAAALLFGVDWGDPLAASALVIAFALVSTGAAMFFGAVLANEQQAGALMPLGLGLAALGGCMVPLEIFSPTMQTIAHVTPHAWAVEGFTELIRSDAGITDIVPQIGVLLGFAAVLLALASWRLRKAITG